MYVEAYGRFMRAEEGKKKRSQGNKNLSNSFLVFTNPKLQETDEELCYTIQYWYIFQQRDIIVFLLIPLMQGILVRTALRIHFLTFFIKYFKVIHGNEIPFCFDP